MSLLPRERDAAAGTETGSPGRYNPCMRATPRSLLPWLLCAGTVLSQEPLEQEPPAFEGDPFAKIEHDDKLIDLQWRRAANGDLEWAIAGEKEAKWKRVFGESLESVFGITGFASYVLPLVHHGDLLSLTDGEAHFRRLQFACDTRALLAFAKAPLSKTPSRIDELDRLVAVDVLRSRADEAAKAALAQLAADADAPAAVRARAGALPGRERLTAEDLLLPERADLYVMIDHARLVDAHGLLVLARLSGLISSAMVLQQLKRPWLSDAAIGQAESDAVLELPFELVRRLGAIRFDHTCVSLSWSGDFDGPLLWAGATVGSFEPARIAAAARGLGLANLEVAARDDGATATWSTGAAAVAARRATARASGIDVAPREAIAKQLLREGSYAIRIQVPEGSKVLAMMTLGGLANVTAYALEATWGDPIVCVETFTMKDEAAANAMSGKVGLLMERFAEQHGQGELFEKIGPPEVTVATSTVTSTRKVPFSRLPLRDVEAARKWLLERWR